MRQLNKNELLYLYNNGESLKTIMQHFKCGHRILKRTLTHLGLNFKNRHYKPKRFPDKKNIGRKFNFLTISGFEYNPKKKIWLTNIICQCGNESTEILRKIKNGQRKTCGKTECKYFHIVRRENGRKASFTGYKEIYGCKWAVWKCGAIKRKLEFNITLKYAWKIFLKQERKCALTGVCIYFGTAWNKEQTASLDRIDSSKGYIIGNIQWVHKRINLMKGNLNEKDFIEWCTKVATKRTTIVA